MQNSKGLLKMLVVSMLVALGVVISPILRFEGMCPMAHFINITCSVLMGPWYSLLCATLIGIIRMAFMAIPPLALTGAVFGAFLSGVLYRMSKGRLLFAVLGEIVGTGIVGAIISYPVMTLLWGKDGLSLFFYVPSFLCGTFIGGSIAFVFLQKLSRSGLLSQMQAMVSSESYTDKETVLSTSVSFAALGVICFLVIEILTDIFDIGSPLWPCLSRLLLGFFIVFAVVYYFIKRERRAKVNE